MDNEVTVIGAGVVGLAIAGELSLAGKEVMVIEKNISFGQETSSRNSEVIHAGIYYPPDSLKARTCVEGRQLLYDFCRRNDIGHKKIGKLIVANNENEIKDLEALLENGRSSGVTDLRLLSQEEVKRVEPAIEAKAAIYSPSTGIIDSHALMKSLTWEIKENGGQIAYDTRVCGIEKIKDGFNVRVEDRKGEAFSITTKALINSAGLNSDKMAAMAGINRDDYKLKYCKGDYFRVDAAISRLISHLVYPVPRKKGAGLGIHATLDLAGSLRLGPDDQYVEDIDYNIDPAKQKDFYESSRQFLPFIRLDAIRPDSSGIRPKLQGPGEGFRDFLIKEESDNGLPGLVDLIGIESPGLTACLSIARLVKEIALSRLP
ncbi:MAG: NAD(P)/FAD-dependent oxidoreductase [Candidatus Omnitrophota bacterium]